MPTNPIDTLNTLNRITLELNQLQSWIDHARTSAPTNQRVQLELDRQQADIDARRETVKNALVYIAMLN